MNTALLGLLLCCTVLRRMKWVFDWQQIDFMQRLWGIKSVRVDLLTILCNQETVHFIFSRTASPQLHLKHGFWNSADIYVFTLKSSLGEICCLFVVWGGSNGDGPEMELDLKKQDAEIGLWLRTGWWTGAAPPCCAVCLTDFTQDTVVERYAPTVAAINKTECICQLKTAHTCMTTIQSMNKVYLMTREMMLSYCAVTTGCYLKLVVTFT